MQYENYYTQVNKDDITLHLYINAKNNLIKNITIGLYLAFFLYCFIG